MKLNVIMALFFAMVFIGTASASPPPTEDLQMMSNLCTGAPVIMERVIDIPMQGTSSFPADHNLVVSTRLDNPQWTYAISRNDVKGPERTVTAGQLVLTASELGWERGVPLSVTVILNGTAPEVSRVTMLSVMDIHETLANGQIAPNTSSSDSQLPVCPKVTETPAPVPTTQKGSIPLFVILGGFIGACGIVHRDGKRQSAGDRM